VPIAPEILLSLSLLVLPAGPGNGADRSDPQALMEMCGRSLERADIPGARSAASRLRRLISADPGWDPDGHIAASLLPELEARIGRLSAAVEELARVAPRDDGATSFDSPEALLAHLAKEQDAARRFSGALETIVQSIPPGLDRCALLLSEPYGRALSAGAARAVPRLTMGPPAGLPPEKLPENERVGILLERLEMLKQEVVSLSVDRESLQGQLKSADRRRREENARLMQFIGYAPAKASPSKEAAGLTELGTALAHRIRDLHQKTGSLTRQSALERAASMAELERLRMVNAISVAEGSRDLRGRLDALGVAIERIPVTGEEPSAGWLTCCFTMCR
jgi:hypothetical protein